MVDKKEKEVVEEKPTVKTLDERVSELEKRVEEFIAHVTDRGANL